MNTVNYLGYNVLNIPYSEARKVLSSGSVLTISPNSYGLATKNEELKKALKDSTILVLDGVYFGLGYFLRTGKVIKKNQGPEIFYEELNLQNKREGKVFFLGSTEKTLKLIGDRLYNEYPNVKFKTMSPPFKEHFSDEDNLIIQENINNFSPDVIMVGLTCPKQEIWINEHRKLYPKTLMLGIGGVFDWFAGNYKELHPIWWKHMLVK